MSTEDPRARRDRRTIVVIDDDPHTSGMLTSWFAVNGLSIPGMEEMAANFNLPPRVYLVVTPLTTLIVTMNNPPGQHVGWQKLLKFSDF